MPEAAAPGEVTVATADGVATIRFHHPKGNSLPAALLRRLADAVTAAGRDDAARVVVLRSEGSGPFFAGASFSELQAVRDAEGGTAFFMGFARLILAMRDCPKFVLARVHGKAVGGGVGVIAASDYAFALRGASVKLSELAIGIGPFVIGPVVERRVGPGPFAALSIDATGWRDADWAERHGLYARVFDDATVMDAELDALATTLARSNPDAMARLKRVFWQGTDHWGTLLPERAAMSGELVLSEFTGRAIGRE
jgi:methylglutaconyl-CoA hydratase